MTDIEECAVQKAALTASIRAVRELARKRMDDGYGYVVDLPAFREAQGAALAALHLQLEDFLDLCRRGSPAALRHRDCDWCPDDMTVQLLWLDELMVELLLCTVEAELLAAEAEGHRRVVAS